MHKIKNKVSQFKNKGVVLTGSVSYKEAGKYINAFDIGVAPFIRERNESIGLSPLKIYDYAACGVPVVASKIAGLEIIETKHFGILVEPENSIALANATIHLLKNTDLRRKFGRNGRKTVEKNFSWNRITKQIIGIGTLPHKTF